MGDVFVAFGRGVVKVLISLFVGGGVGLLTFGIQAGNRPDVWNSRNPPPELFLGIGAGLLSTAGMLLLLFFVPWMWGGKTPPRRAEEVVGNSFADRVRSADRLPPA